MPVRASSAARQCMSHAADQQSRMSLETDAARTSSTSSSSSGGSSRGSSGGAFSSPQPAPQSAPQSTAAHPAHPAHPALNFPSFIAATLSARLNQLIHCRPLLLPRLPHRPLQLRGVPALIKTREEKSKFRDSAPRCICVDDNLGNKVSCTELKEGLPWSKQVPQFNEGHQTRARHQPSAAIK